MIQEPTLFMENTGWCWFQSPRVVVHNGKLVMGGVQGNGNGDALIGVYDLKTGAVLGRTEVCHDFDKDDHNAPAFWVRPDGTLLTVYARHNVDGNHYCRISDSNDYLKWGEEKIVTHKERATYMNLFSIEKEGALYCFYRGVKFNPSFMRSLNHGMTWEPEVHFIQNEVHGRQRPYAIYAQRDENTVAVTFTDAHPRNFGNNIYYAEFHDGSFFRADGSKIKSLAVGGPLRPSEAERIFQGGGGDMRDYAQSALNSAWTSSIACDADSHPHIGYTLYLNNADHRYRMAFWNGKQWVDREVAYAGTCLYDDESSYTGLITLDPRDPQYVVISTDVDPRTGKALGGTHEIYRARVGPQDDITTIQWEPVTQGSRHRNIRPIIVGDEDQRVVLWLRGEYRSFIDYTMSAVGLVERRSL